MHLRITSKLSLALVYTGPGYLSSSTLKGAAWLLRRYFCLMQAWLLTKFC